MSAFNFVGVGRREFSEVLRSRRDQKRMKRPQWVGSRLELAARKCDELVYVGGVGTGFGYAGAMALRKLMDELVIAKPVVSMRGRRQVARWLRPTLAVEVEFRAWTDDGKLRHASYMGLREDAEMGEIYRL